MKTYPIPEYLHNVYMKFFTYDNLKTEFALSRWFGFKKAVKAGYKATRYRNEFWSKVFKLYPEIESVNCKYNQFKRLVTVKEDANGN